MVLASFISFADPILSDVSEVLEELRLDGVSVKILTGDNSIVARHVCRSIGLCDDQVVTGDDIEGLDDGALGHVAEQGVIFARVSPAQKNRIILALKRRGHVVGFMGDGINDAPSLHAADVGISVMARPTWRESADVILSERGCRCSVGSRRPPGLRQHDETADGHQLQLRQCFNVAYLGVLRSTMLHRSLNNFLYDVAQITIPTDNVDELLAPPQRWNMRHTRFHAVHRTNQLVVRFLTSACCSQSFTQATIFHSRWFV
jgi:Mg2+-importing ATPase